MTPEPPATRTGKNVAVVGSGPAGLAAAAQLNQAGHPVTVFERADRIGGLLMYGIPNMKLDKRRRRAPHRSDVRGGRPLRDRGRDRARRPGREPRHRLRRRRPLLRRDAGARPPRRGPDLQGHPPRHGVPPREHARAFSTPGTPTASSSRRQGKNVIVIGGGDTGTDCVGTALRHGPRASSSSSSSRALPTARAPTTPGRSGRRSTGSITATKRRPPLSGGRPARLRPSRRTGSSATSSGRVREIHTMDLDWRKGPDGRFHAGEIPGERARLPGRAGPPRARVRRPREEGPRSTTSR